MRHFKLNISFLFFLVPAISAHAEVSDENPEWQSTCVKSTGLSSILFKSKSGDVSEDDFMIELHWLNGNKAPLNAPEAWYLSRPSLSLPSNACSGIGTLELSDGLLLLVLPFNGRPGWNRVSAALIDVKEQKVVEIKADIGEITGDYKHQVTGDTFSLYLFKEWKIGKDGGEEGVPAWYDLKIVNGKIIGSWKK